jgi:hypothetical protein
MTEQRSFILGEEKYVEFQVRSTKTQTVIITSATYQLSKSGAETMTGNCEIDGDIISILLEPVEKGMHLLEVTYVIAEETRKVRINLLVV